jgi:hypothetical protein
VMPDRIELKKLAIERVREPRKRMPVRLIERGERPGNRAPAQPRAHLRVVDDIAVVIKIHKTVMRHRVVECQRHHYQQKTEHQFALPRRTEHSLRFLGYDRRFGGRCGHGWR